MKKYIFLVDEFPRLGGAETVVKNFSEELLLQGHNVQILAKTPGKNKIYINAKTKFWSPLSKFKKRSVLENLNVVNMLPLGNIYILKRLYLLNSIIKFLEIILVNYFFYRIDENTVIVSTRADMLDEIRERLIIDKNLFKAKIINQFHASLDPMGEYGAFLESVEKNLDIIDGFTALSSKCSKYSENRWGKPALTLPNPKDKNNMGYTRNKSKKIVIASRLVESKQVDLAIDIFLKFRENPKYHDFILEIFGDGEEKVKISQLIAERKVSDIITLKGFSNSLEEMFSGAMVNLVTSRFEGRPMVILEAACFGVPSIAFNVSGGVEEQVKSLNGKLITPFDTEEFVEKLVEIVECNSQDKTKEILDKSHQYNPACIAKKFLTWENHI